MIINRRAILRVVSTGGVAVGAAALAPSLPAAASADPCLAFIQKWSAVQEEAERLPSGSGDTFWQTAVRPFEEVATYGTIPAAATAEGAVAALRKALAFGDMEQQDANLVRAALVYLEAASDG